MPRKGLPWARRSGPLQVERGIMLSTKTTTRASNPGPWPSSCKTHNLMQRTEHLVLWLEVALAIPYLASQLLTRPLPHFSLQVPTTETLKACQFSRSSSWMSPSPTANFLQTLGSQTSQPWPVLCLHISSGQCHIHRCFSPSEPRVLSQSSSFRNSGLPEH